MITHQLTPLAALKTSLRCFAVVITLFLWASSAAAQTQATSAVDGTTPAGLAPGSPSGSYQLSGFETVNLFNGSLNFRLPLLAVGGRGAAGYGVTLQVEQKWVVKSGQPSPSGEVSLSPNPNWWQGIRPGYGPGVLHGRRGNHEDERVEDTYGCDAVGQGCSTVLREVRLRTLTRLTFTASDGTEYELHDQQTGGEPQHAIWYQQTGNRDGFARGRVFVTADGGSATFISDAEVEDYVAPNMTLSQRLFYPTGHLLLADGTRYRVDSGVVSWLRDRNGNRVAFTYDGSGRVGSATDPLGRRVTFTYDDGVRRYDEIGFSGFGGQPRTIRVWYDTLYRRLRPGSGYSLKTFYELFALNSASTTSKYDPPNKVSEVELPDGRRYRLWYNPWGELARVELPTGGAVEYDWGGGADAADATIFRHVTRRRVYPDGGSDWVSQTEYVRDGDGSDSAVEERTTDAGGALLARAVHHFHGDALASMAPDPARPAAISYGKWREGRERRTELFDVAGGAAVLKRVVERVWRQPVAGQTWPLAGEGETDEAARPNVPLVAEEVTTLSDTGQASKRAFAYDRYGNPTDTREYDYGAGTAGPLVRHTRTDYLTTNAVGGTTHDYACDPETTCSNANINASVIHQRGLPAAQRVYAVDATTGAETLVAKSEMRYDEAAYPLLTCGTAGSPVTCDHAPQWDDLGAAPRGNATTARRWLDTTNSWVETHAQYDGVGNVRHSWDAKGNLSQVSYLDSFCNDNGARCGGTFTPNTFAFPTSTKTPKPDPSGTYGSAAELTSSTVYDFYTGLVYSAADANGNVTRFEYEGGARQLDRLKAVVRPDGGRTDYDYGDEAGNLYLLVRTDLDAREMQSKQYFDGLGRPYRAASFENAVAAEPWVNVDTRYDALGRVVMSSMPYRSARGGAPLTDQEWANAKRAETEYDALGRVLKVTTRPDGAAVNTDYGGDRVLVTDQAGRRRLSRTDALGRLAEVWEVTPDDPAQYPGVESIPAAVTAGLLGSGHGYRTEYSYDAAGNLRRVKQGGQQRFFAYDSLGRLVRAKNPEQGAFAAGGDFPALTDATSGVSNSQWSFGYLYDANGNLTRRRDARGTTTTYGYDALNRNVTVAYTPAGQTAATPSVYRYYDNPTPGANGRGRPYYVAQGGSTTTATYIDRYDAAGRVLAQRQRFETNGVWSPHDYRVEVEYNLAGGVTKLTYPSGRRVEYRYDAMGRLGDDGGQPAFKGTLGGGAEKTYVSQVLYDELGGVSQERFGTGTPVFNKRFYNSRGQLGEIRVSTHSITNADQSLRTDWNRGAVINHYGESGWGASGGGPDNNGNLRKQDVYIPADDAISGHSLTTTFYEYDALNRLRKAKEGRGGTDQWMQEYGYDRWGNRTVNAAGTWLTQPSAPPSDLVNEKQFDGGDLPQTNRLYAPGDTALPDSQRLMRYDAAGNLTYDGYTGGGARAYDAENRMTSAQFLSGQTQTAAYVYDGDGRRVRRMAGSAAEVWQVYGAGGELLAEYAPNAAPAQPQKEYGYRGGELLVTAAPAASAPATPAGPLKNVALASNGGVASASSTHAAYSLSAVNDGDRKGPGHGGVWGDSTNNAYPDWVQIDFGGSKAVTEVALFSVQNGGFTNSVEPAATMTGSQYVVTSFEVEYRTGSGGWATIPGSSVTGNDLIWRRVTFPEVVTTGVRVVIHATADNYSQVPEVEVWGRDTASARTNHALASNGAGVSASSEAGAGYPASAAIDGDRKGLNWGAGGGWADGTSDGYPDWLEVDFGGERRVDEVQLFGVQENYANPAEPTEAMTSRYALTDFEVQYQTGSQWVTVQGGAVTGNDRVWRRFSFPEVTASKVRVVATRVAGDNHSSVAELEAWGPTTSSADVRWVVTDHLGTPRMVLDKTGGLTSPDGRSGMSRHDYFPFGEEIQVGVGGRTTTQGYSQFDGIRQQVTGKERDNETGLDYFGARYYGSTQGRFTTVDPLMTSGTVYDPQTWNRYSYAINNPLKWTDPDGLYIWSDSLGGNVTDEELRRRAGNDRNALRDANRIIDRRNDFRNALTAAGRARDALPAGADRDLVSASLASYGAEGTANGVSVGQGRLADGVAAEARTGFTTDPNTFVTSAVAEVVISDGGSGNLAVDVAHEGRHVADAQAYATAFTAEILGSGTADNTIAGPLNLTRYEREVRGYTVSSLVAQGLGLDNLSVGRREIWNRGWSQADRAILRSRAIDNHLRESRTYRLTPQNPGERYMPRP